MFRKADKERLIAIEGSLSRLHARVDSIQRLEQGQNVLKADLDALSERLEKTISIQATDQLFALLGAIHDRMDRIERRGSKSSPKPKRKRR